ncbi:MAG: acyl carrier protein [Rhodocyclaceae bacterium]|nr:acyl carrier protein [Rhodocyclaceae bacterium]MCP5233742.1 acyl carrier protein [Zoogloeaceae bacterium]MCB1912714.1 acyl carrier protein [Rhodocyclaceae bacterium]MCP5241785.1 acyl carrier protein [Zoogloeaceae bacterium]MCP5294283.1 acyl carrier protein [Zoogloeaceae bacterium]
MSVYESLREILASTLKTDVANIDKASSVKTLPAWDSLAHVNLMVALEDSFDIELEPEDFPKLTSVAAICEHLERLGVS